MAGDVNPLFFFWTASSGLNGLFGDIQHKIVINGVRIIINQYTFDLSRYLVFLVLILLLFIQDK